MRVFDLAESLREGLSGIDGIELKPSGGLKSFGSRGAYALSLAGKEKELLVFAVLQWMTIPAAFWVFEQGLFVLQQIETYYEFEERGPLFARLLVLLLMTWACVCVGFAAYPIGILTGCMGAVHFLRRQGSESTVINCLRLVWPQRTVLWSIHWIDGMITVNQLISRIPGRDDKQSAAEKAADEVVYYSWKLGVAGVLPSILTGNGLMESGKNSIAFVKDNFIEVAELRAAYSILCWAVGIATFVVAQGPGFFPEFSAILPRLSIFQSVLIAIGVLMLVLRPIYVLALCDLYSDHLESRSSFPKALPNSPAR